MADLKREVAFVIGHKNPDTDSICSAIAFADIKNRTNSDPNIYYVPLRAGHINSETRFVLEKFGVEAPEYITDVGTQVKDMDIRKSPKVDRYCTLKKAWKIMKENALVTLPVRKDDDSLDGIISLGDIARTYMESAVDTKMLSSAQVSFGAIAETINGEIILGDPDAKMKEGKVLVGAADPEIILPHVGKGDLVILASLSTHPIEIMEKGASCIIMTLSIPVSDEMIEEAKKTGCVIISTYADTYTVARQLIQSIPIEYIMKTDNLLTFNAEDYTEDIKATLTDSRHRAFPVIDKNGKCIGTISRRNFLGIRKKKVLLVDHNDMDQAVDNIEAAEILEIIDHHKVGNVQTTQPILFRNEPMGCTATIIFRIYQEERVDPSPAIAGLMCAAIISDTLMFRSPTCTILDKMAAGSLALLAGIEIEKFAKEMFMAGSDFEHKSPEAIFYTDFKKFNTEKILFGIGQVSSMASEELAGVKEKLLSFMPTQCGEKTGINQIYFMLTDILAETTELLFCGEGTREIVEEAFKVTTDGNSCMLPGVISRKKQLLPKLLSAMQES